MERVTHQPRPAFRAVGAMKTPRYRRVAIFLLLTLLVFGFTSAWCVRNVFLWAKDLPNRIQFQFEGDGFAEMMTEAARSAVRDGDVQTQIESLTILRDGIHAEPAMSSYVQQNFAAEILPLRMSGNSQVASLASEISELAGFLASDEDEFDLKHLGTNPASATNPNISP